MLTHGPVLFSLINEVDTLLLGLDPSQKIGSQTYHRISLGKHAATFRIHPPAFTACAMTLSLFLVISMVHFYFQTCQSFPIALACSASLQFCAFARSVSTARNAFPLGLPAELLLSFPSRQSRQRCVIHALMVTLQCLILLQWWHLSHFLIIICVDVCLPSLNCEPPQVENYILFITEFSAPNIKLNQMK